MPATTRPQAGGDAVIEVRDLSKSFGERPALRGVTFKAQRGELLAVIGPNGAGKTTLLSILAGIRSPDSGEVSRAPAEIGWVPQQAALYRRLTVTENLRLFAKLEGVDDPEAAVEGMLEQTGLADRRDDQVAELSAATSSASTSRSACSRGRPCCCWTSPPRASTRASASACGSSSWPSPAAARP
jgi:ABC-type Fe3+/spermidine/putrescine transport system ATPase subunit